MRSISSVSRFPFHLVLAVCSILIPSVATAATPVTVNVDCSNPKAKVKTIAAGLAQVPTAGPSTLLVSGTCHENVTIQGYNLLTVQGNPTATIDGGTDPNLGTFDIGRSSVNLNNLIISGGGAGVECFWLCSAVMDHVTIQDSLGFGLVVQRQSFARLNMGTIEHNAFTGVSVEESTLVLRGGTIQANGTVDEGGDGVTVGTSGTLYVFPDDSGTVPSIIQNNPYGNGISVANNSTVRVNGATISGNGGDGIGLNAGSVAQIRITTITANGNHGVRIGDLSIARFQGGNSISGNTGSEVVCDPQFSTTRGIGNLSLPEGETNCPAEVPTNP